ncbi:sphingosine-1-phosphate phosphatase 1 [Austrofundulus limnaeus]|uniref:Sphingosine-1-phosphate phosphatase 1 n=1 Tax=Austrofundulus limnaeus TaxID=52670 RepID=A0A2I4CSF7_AUSLI|nr:PREDICTED: sphingosine-1-phosphate phosphatase 1 [Austrofundulus limnaeus]
MEKMKERFRSLQDPNLVARFQHLCGVRGTGGSKAASRAHLHNNGASHHPVTGDAGGESSAGLGTGEGQHVQTAAPGFRRRIQDLKLDLCGNGSAGGEPAGSEDSSDPGSSRSSTVKPLRKNSLTGDVGQEFVIQNRFLYYLFTFGTELGNEFFYITFFPFVMWNLDAFISRRLIMVWVWVMYLGQCTKDVVRWSRPASPPVVKVEVFYNSEYSMPSTHAMSGTAIPFSLFYMTYDRWEDVIAGFLYSILILVLFLPVLDLIEGFNRTCSYAPLLIISLHLGLGLFSFTLDTWSTSRGDTAQILGTGAGVALASHVNYRLGLLPDPGPDQLPLALPVLSAGTVGLAVLRLVLGVLVLVGSRGLMKALTIPVVCRVLGVPSSDVRRARQHMEVELPYRYIVYGTVGFNVLFLVPLLFSFLQLS